VEIGENELQQFDIDCALAETFNGIVLCTGNDAVKA